MERLIYTLQSYFLHKDFLVRDNLVGMMFSPLHLCLSALLLAAIIFAAIRLRKCDHKTVRRIMAVLWAVINFFYPANVLSNYSCLSFAGAHTMLFHGVMLFCCLLMQTTGYHRYTHLNKPWELILPAIPTLIVSIPANLVNYSPIGSDYMFFKCNSFFLPALFGWLEDWQSTVILYVLYLLLPVAFYLPGMIYKRQINKARAA